MGDRTLWGEKEINSRVESLFRNEGDFDAAEVDFSCHAQNLIEQRGQKFLCLEITLSGSLIEAAVNDFFSQNLREDRRNSLSARWGKDFCFFWLLPGNPEGEKGDNPEFVDVHGRRWISPLLLLPPGKEAPERVGNDKNLPIPLSSCPARLGSGGWRVVPDFWQKAEGRWRRFVRALGDAKKVKKPLTYKSLVDLEAALNALWTSHQAREEMMPIFTENKDINQLRLKEMKRQVNIYFNSAESGRIRLPHLSHRGRLCPYQTPESKKIGLQLFRTVGSKYSLREERIEEGNDPVSLLSLAVGLIPYPHHSDGPRLLMGGKNMKQAEHRIAALRTPVGELSPTARVPGYLESAIDSSEELDIENHRYKYPLGVDALVAVMPYMGFTYEDGLVVSREFADRLRISDGIYVQREVVNSFLSGAISDKNHTAPSSVAENFEGELKAYIGNTYAYDALLPLPLELEAQKILDRANIPSLRYQYRYEGILKECRVNVIPGRAEIGSRKERVEKAETAEGDASNKRIPLQVEIRYVFEVDRPLMVGDKLTGRHGNKGVVTHILEVPAQVVVDGVKLPVDLMISPCALMGRKNLGQLYEMMHSLLLWGLEENRFDRPEYTEFRSVLTKVTRNTLLTHGEMTRLLPVINRMAGSPDATFEVELPAISGSPKNARAFVGYQHIARLHHHVKAKLQYRAERGPVNSRLGQPASGGGTAGQRLGEMENWSCLSHPVVDSGKGGFDSLDLLLKMRSRRDEKETTQQLFSSILWGLGFNVGEDGKLFCVDNASLRNEKSLGEAQDLFSVRSRLYQLAAQYGRRIPPDTGPDRYHVFALKKDGTSNLKALLDGALELSEVSAGQAHMLRSLFAGDAFLPVSFSVLLSYPSVRDAFSDMVDAFSSFDRQATGQNARRLVGGKKEKGGAGAVDGAIITYYKALQALLKGKMGLLRRHMLGRRLSHSARGVIVPCPDLHLDEVRLPASMLEGMLSDAVRLRLKLPRQSVDVSTLNAVLAASPVWVILIRQPSLHRHNFMAFRVSCWEKNVVGIPPFATPGYNADFDGDTMAVFLPPEPYASDLSPMTLLNNPGLVGTGSLALARDLDLALGWMNICLEKKNVYAAWLEESQNASSGAIVSLGNVLEGLFRKYPNDKSSLREKIRDLQIAVCEASTGAASMSPVDFENLSRKMEMEMAPYTTPEGFDCKEKAIDDLEKEIEGTLQKWVEDNHGASDLARFVKYGVKGGTKELRVMTAFLGKQSEYEEYEKEDGAIHGCFWRGLSDDELFRYGYATRSSMSSKKLDVAKAGYLSRLLAEGLYETKIEAERCGCRTGMTVFCRDKALYLKFKDDEIRFPLLGDFDGKNLKSALGRIAWGRELLNARYLVTSGDIADIAAFWSEGKQAKTLSKLLDASDALVLRSALTCLQGGRNVCAACTGADPATRPYDAPVLMLAGTRVGLTAAQAIGERGTQLAMQRFHDTGSMGNKRSRGKAEDELNASGKGKTLIELLSGLLIRGNDDLGEGGSAKDQDVLPSDTRLRRFFLLVGKVLTEKDSGKASKELLQQLVHFELALRAPSGLDAWAAEISSRWLSALSYESVGGTLEKLRAEGSESEAWGVKSRLIWNENEREKAGARGGGRL